MLLFFGREAATQKKRRDLFLVYFYLFVSCLGCFIAMDLFPQGLSSKVAEKKSSLGRECACFGCGSTFYNKDGSASGIHFFRFPAKNPRKQRWCNLIKRHDGKDDFKVTISTFLCHFHFKEEDIKKTINMWRLRPDVDPSLNLYVGSSSSKSSSKRRGPRPRFTPQKSCRKKLNLNDADDDINMSGIKELFDDADNTSTCSIETQTAAVRIHVERAIGRVKNYHILDGVLPLSLSAVADQIFTVCCYLTNFLPPLVPPANQQK